MKIFGSIQELVELVYRIGSNTVTLKPNASQATTATVSLPNVTTATDTVVTQAASQALSNKTSIQVDNLTLDGDTITGINNIQLQPGASGSVLISRPLRLVSSSSIILQDLDNSHSITISAPAAVTVNRTPEIPDDTGNFVLTSAGQSLTNKTISGTANTLSNISLTSSVTGVLPAANGGTGVNSTATFPSSGTVAVLTDISASQLSGIVPGSKGGTGVNNAGTLTYGTNNITLTTSGVTSLTLPTSGTVVTEGGSATLLNKLISSTAALTGALTLPAGTEAERPASPVDGMVRYNSSSGSFEGRANGNWSGIGGGGTTDLITQASHGFAVGDVLYLSGSTYTKAIATAANTAEVVGIVSRVVSSSQFEMTLSGEISGLIASSFAEGTLPAVGEALFLSDSVAGKLTITEPSTIGYVSIPVGVVSESVVGPPASRKMYVAIKRGVVVGGANARTQIPLGGSTSTSVTTTVQNVAAYEAGELSGWIAISATTPLKFYVTAQFSKNGAGNNYNISYQTSGDTPPVGFLLQVTAAGLIQAVLPSITGFTSASITYGLDVVAIGTSFPLSVDGSSITTGTINAVRIPSLDASKIATGTLDAARIPSLDSSKIVWSEPVAFRNKIINGSFDVWQRGTADTALSQGYLADRWGHNHFQDGLVTQQPLVVSGEHPGNSRFVARVSGDATATTSRLSLDQGIELANTIPLRGKTITASFYVRFSAATFSGTTSFNAELGFSNTSNDGNFVNTNYIATASNNTLILNGSYPTTWKKYTVSIPVGLSAQNIALRFRFNDLTDRSTSDWYEISQVQVEEGTIATPFEHRPIGTELALCQRYFQRISGLSVALVPEGSSGNNCRAGILLPVSIRSSASGTHTGSILVNGVVQTYTSRSFGASGNICNITAFGGPSAYGNSVTGTLDFDVNAEL